ncbi:MAG: PAS domain S-box protein [Bacteroidia bacterium]|nr:PAS domain S-box protein [Bacteroidia bacterium]
MTWFKDISLRKKLVLITSTITLIALILSSTAIVFNEIKVLRELWIDELSSLTQVLGDNSISTLVFNDNVEANKILSSLIHESDIVNAYILDEHGNLFAQYNKAGYEKYAFSKIKPDSYIINEGFIIISHNLVFNDNNIGTILLRSNMERIESVTMDNIKVITLVIFAVIIFTFLLSSFMQKTISNPIKNLADFMQSISKTTDYSQRIETTRSDEIGHLTSSFNHMLQEIQIKETALKHSEERFRKIVEYSPNPILMYRNSKIVYINQAGIDLFNANSVDDLIGKNALDLVHPDYRNVGNEKHQLSQNDVISPVTEEKFIKLDGKVIDVEVTRFVVYYQEKPSIIAMVKDITKRKMLAKQLIAEKNKRLFDIIETQEEERHRIATDLHDGLGQTLTAISFNIENLKNDLDTKKEVRTELVEDLQIHITTALNETKNISYNLMPVILYDLGLEPALKLLCRNIEGNNSIKVEFMYVNNEKFSNKRLNTCLYRITQEALNNIVKHSNASKAEIHIFNSEKTIFLVIEDNGNGFDPKTKAQPGMGINNIHNRAIALNGKVNINSTVGVGTEIIVEIPMS